jgi:hypothetical protein
MTPTFHAACVSVENTDSYLQVGFADREFETAEYLMLQRAQKVDEQDKRLGLAGVYVERNDQAISMYGGIERFELLPGRVRVLFDEQGLKVMCGLRETEVTFDRSGEALVELRAALRRCFEGLDCYSENVA